jgi:hypothetical protein
LTHYIDELIIFRNWKLEHWPRSPAYIGKSIKLLIKEKWETPSICHFKLNFDGESKGNPRPSRSGRVIRDREGNIRRIFSIEMGRSSNNEAKIAWMLRGM